MLHHHRYSTEILIIHYHCIKNVIFVKSVYSPTLIQLLRFNAVNNSTVNVSVHVYHRPIVSTTLNCPHFLWKSVGINSHGSAGNSHSNWGGFPFPPIPIPNSEFYSHSHGIPMGFPFPLKSPFPCTSLITTSTSRGLVVHLFVRHACAGVRPGQTDINFEQFNCMLLVKTFLLGVLKSVTRL